MLESLNLSTFLPAGPQRVFQAWLDSQAHSNFTGSLAQIDPGIGGRFTAWDGYIQGTTLEVEPFHRILQSWRTTDFPPGSPDSRLEVLLEPADQGTELTLVHTGIPAGQGEGYRQGWEDYYFETMRVFFAVPNE
jgi:uncharacterized protein YndB with AHSA1/START domain